MKLAATLLLLVPIVTVAPRPSSAAEKPLEIAGALPRTGTLGLAELEAMAPVTATWTLGDRRRQVRGVSLDKLLGHFGFQMGAMGDDQAREKPSSGWRRAVVASAADGFEAVFSIAELAAHLGGTRALVAWQIDGKPLPADKGPLRLVVLTDKNPSRAVYALNKIAVVELGGAPGKSGLAKVAAIHGAAGPFAVAGQRMGERALRELGLASGSFDLEVRHESPAEVQWSCIADGAQAATGASAGKLNLQHQPVAREAMRTVFRRKSTGKSVTFRLKPTFVKRFADLPRAELQRAGESVLALGDDEIFSVERS